MITEDFNNQVSEDTESLQSTMHMDNAYTTSTLIQSTNIHKNKYVQV